MVRVPMLVDSRKEAKKVSINSAWDASVGTLFAGRATGCVRYTIPSIQRTKPLSDQATGKKAGRRVARLVSSGKP